ncbi:MAG: hypothetical protein JWN15_1858 [Firmicutes bacterium]|nr:hypothetical protein [Bacillota bacterium]
MRRVKGYIHIQAPVQRVRTLAGAGSTEWMVARSGLLGPTRTSTWDATEMDGGTRFTLQMEYGSRLPFLDSLVADDLHHSLAQSLSRLKHLAEHPGG